MAKRAPRSTIKRKSSPKKKTGKKRSGKITAYCLPCRKKCTIDSDYKLVKKKLKNGRVATILCGHCSTYKHKVCKIIGNNAK